MRGIGFKENLEVSITNREEVDETFDEIRTSRYTTDNEQELVDALVAHQHPQKLVKHGMKVFVRTMIGRSFAFLVNPNDTIRTMKLKIQGKTGIRPELQRLTFDGDLKDDLTLQHYNIQDRSILRLFLKPSRQDSK